MRHADLEYVSPVCFTLKQRLTLSIISFAFSFFYRVLCLTCRVNVRDLGNLQKLEEGHGGVIIAFWHEVLPLAIWTQRNTGYHTLTSYSYDGELAARVIEPFGIHAVRGSSSRGGREALEQLEKALRLGVTVGITLDGPRGPRRESKPGVAILSGRTGAPIIPLVLGVSPCWRLRSWDRMVLPKPFSHIVCAFGEPIAAAQDASPEEVERVRLEVERKLNALQLALETELGDDAQWDQSPDRERH